MTKRMMELEAELSAAFDTEWSSEGATGAQGGELDPGTRAIDMDLVPLGGSRPRIN